MRKILAIIAGAIAALAIASPAHADWNDSLLPYDAPCVLAQQHPHGVAAKRCRAHGWIVARHVVVDPQHRLRWSDRGRWFTLNNIRKSSTRTAVLHRPGHAPVRVKLIVSRDIPTPSMDAALDATVEHRDWTRCVYMTGQGILGALYRSDVVISCPGGWGRVYTLGPAYRPGDFIPKPDFPNGE